MPKPKSFTLKELAKVTDSTLFGDKNCVVDNLSTIENSSKSSITFLSNNKYASLLASSNAAAVIVNKDFKEDDRFNYLKTDDPYLTYAKISNLFAEDDEIKIPFIQQVQFLDRRILDLDSPAEEVIASDQKRLVVDSFTRWQISDPLQFYISVRDERIARSRLQAIVSSSLRSVLGGEEFVTVVRDDRDELMARISEIVNEQARDLGINIIDVRIKRADLPDANSQAIYLSLIHI